MRDTERSSNIIKKEDRHLNEQELVIEAKNILKAHERLGFGYLALFRTMRFLALITFLLAIMMFIAGSANWRASPVAITGFNTFDLFSMANVDYSAPTCI